MHKLRDHLGERLVCALVGAVILGGVTGSVEVGWVNGLIWLMPTGMALLGFVLGALLGERLLAWLKIR